MQQYEIRLTETCKDPRVSSHLLANDHAAIRRGMWLSRQSEQFEVWRADTCIYASGDSRRGQV
jgi:hypothetical protein